MQLSLLSDVDSDVSLQKPDSGSGLRDYQSRIAEQALSLLANRQSPITVAATGTGKTRIASAVVGAFAGRVLWIAHRIELVKQAGAALERELGGSVEFETPGSYSGNARVVVASKDTIRGPRRIDRLKNFNPFDLIVIDECHHSAARSYQCIIEAFPRCLRYGLTATPGRLDKKLLRAFDSATEPFGIVDASCAGWLVPIRAKRERVASVDLSGIKTVAGDFDKAELDAVMRSEANLHAVAQSILDRLSAGPALSFTTSVATAERQAEILNRYRAGVARFVSGSTPSGDRTRAFAEFGKGYQVLVNVGVATEGTDLPSAAIIAMGRPTKSTALFQQMLGRGLRPLPGTVDGLSGPRDRLAAIAASAKPFCLVLDFVGVTGRHSVATSVDALSGGTAPCVAERVRERLESGEEIDVAGALAEELAAESARSARSKERRKRDEERRAALVGSVVLDSEDVRLIGLGGNEHEPDGPVMDGPPTVGQVTWMSKLGIDITLASTARIARTMILDARKKLDLASPKQLALVQKYRPAAYNPGLTRKAAGFMINQITRYWK